MDEIWDLIESVSEGFLTYSCFVFISFEVPRPPNGPIQYSDLTQSSITMTWKPPDKESPQINGYKVNYRSSDDLCWKDPGFVTGTSWTQSYLLKDVGCMFRVISVNSKGESEPLESIEEMKLRK